MVGGYSQTYVINSAGGGDFVSFNAAYNAIKAGPLTQPVIFNVVAGSGPYNEQLILKAIPGASATNTIKFNCNGVQMGTAFTGTTTGQRAIVKLDGGSFYRIDSLTINATAGSTYGYGLQLIRDADSNIISRCSIITNTTSNNNANYGAVVINGTDGGLIATGNTLCDYNVFVGNKIKGGYYGVTCVGTEPGGTNGHNRFIGNSVNDFYQYGFYFSGTYNSIIDSNIISRPTRTSVGAFYGVHMTGTNQLDTVSRNFIQQPFDGAPGNSGDFYGINHDNVKPLAGFENVVINNIVSASKGIGKTFGIANNLSSNIQYYFNTVSIENELATSTQACRGFSQTGAADGILFYNNLVSIYRGGTGQKHCIYLSGTSISFISDYNNLFVSANGTNNYIGAKTGNSATLQAWRTSTGLDLFSTSVDPVYVDTANENYKPQNAAFDNKALNLAGLIDYDIYNQPRSTTPDAGAIEFVPPPCVAPPTAGITLFYQTTKVDTTVCENTNMQLGLLGNSFGSFQTFQWETAPASSGPWTALGNVLNLPDTVITASSTIFLRCAVTCGASTVYSNALKLNVIAALPAGTYTINKLGTPTYVPGVSGGNFVSFADAKDAMSCGIRGNGPIVFNVLNGPSTAPYKEQFILGPINGTSPVNTITFNGNGNTIAYSSNVGTQKAVIKLAGSKYIIFDSLVINAKADSLNGFGVHLLSNADSNIFRKCTIIVDTATTSNSFAGIVINGSAGSATGTGSSLCDNNLFDRNTIIGGYYGIVTIGSTTSVINNNVFTNNIIRDFYNYGIYLGSGNFNTIVEGNRISRPARFNSASTIYGIYVKGAGSASTLISKNRIYNLMGGLPTGTNTIYAITHDDADGATGNPHTVVNNLIFNMTGAGTVYGLNNIGSTFINYYHNTVAIENLGQNPTGNSRGISQSGTSTGTLIKNNMITISRDGAGTKHVIYLGTQGDVESDYNNLYINSTGGIQNFLGYNGVNRLDLGAWQANTTPAQDVNSESYDPGYVNPLVEDYRAVVSPLDNKGTSLGVVTDILDVVRNSPPDMGAFEFTVPPCSAPTVTTATVAPNAGICVGVPIVLDVPGAVSASGLTYVWQNSPDGLGNWTNISDTLYFPKFNTVSLPNRFYRLQIICSGTVYYSSVVSINMNLLLVGGSYTINKNNPTNYAGVAGANFNSYADAIAQMNCGITGPITFNVSADTYTEQVLIKKVPGLGIVNAFGRNTVTFQSANAATSILTFVPTVATANYTVKIDSAKYVTFRNLSVANTSTAFGRVFDISGTSGFDTVMNCIITTPATTTSANTFAAIYSSAVSNLYIKGNTISNGSAGIYITATAANNNTGIVVDGNTISGTYNYGIYTGFSKRVWLANNNVTITSPITTTAYGIYTTDCDTAYRVLRNTVNINNVTTGSATGIYTVNCNSPLSDSGIIASNKVIGGAGNTANVYGLVNYTSSGSYTINNTVAISTAGTNSYGLHSYNTDDVCYYNNSVNMSIPTGTNTYAAYFNHSATTANVKIRNNIFSNKGAGKALYVNNATYFIGNYNNLYTAGAVLVQVQTPAANYATLQPFNIAYNWELNSIVFPPAFVSDLDLQPNLNNPDVWAIHGRGIQIPENGYDFNNNLRPTTLTAGVPDLGAYEFHPNVDPTALVGIPSATPAPNTTQTFMYGSDTVMKLTWGATAPASVLVRRYSGDAPRVLSPGSDSMYFYTKVETSSGGNFPYSIEQFYIDPWQGSIPDLHRVGLGRTIQSNAWVVGFSSSVDFNKRVIYQTGLTYLDKFTGLVNPYAPVIGPDIDSSNKGKRFWVAYPINQLNGGQDMVLYLSADQPANVQVKINGTTWVRNYSVPANTVRVSDIIPKAGAQNAFTMAPGLSDRGISITSDVPIVAYAHIYGSASSGASMLMPVGVWGYDYQALGITQDYGLSSYSYFYVIADNDNTAVEITSTAGIPLQASTPTIVPGVPTTIILNKGEFFQVIAESETIDELSGSIVKSVANSQGKCFPIAVFSGSSRTAIDCPTTGGSGGDFMMQQNFPNQAWGKNYLTAPSSASTAANSLQPNLFRVAVRNPATVVRKNGVPLTGLNPAGKFYEYVSSTSDFIEADQPVIVAQYLTGACTGNGDPEMIYLSPIVQGIKNIGFYRNTVQGIDANLLTLIVPTNGVPSLKIYEGTNPAPVAPSYTYPHARNGSPGLKGVNYTVIVKRWTAAQQQVRVTCDSAYTAITYGLGSVESYGYNAGTLVKNLKILDSTSIPSGNGSGFTCANTPVKIFALVPLVPDSIKFQLSAVPVTPNADITFNPAIPTDTVLNANGDPFYVFELPGTYTFDAPGVYGIPIKYWSQFIESCDKSKEDVIYIQVLPAPRPTFSVTSPVCEGDTTFFKADSLTENGLRITKWFWSFHDGTTLSPNTLDPYKIFPAGTYRDTLRTITFDGCIGDTIRDVVVTVRPSVDVVQDTVIACFDSSATFVVLNPIPGATYNWYDSANGVIPIAINDTFIAPNITTAVNYWVEVIYGCTGAVRKMVTALVLPGLPKPLPVAAVGVSDITWTWPAIAGATGYQVSVVGSGTWADPSSGPTGLTHIITGLAPQQQVCLLVRVLGTTSCETNTSDPVCGQVGCPVVNITVTPPTDTVCINQTLTFTASSTPSGYTFNWYDAATGGTLLFTGDTYSTTAVSSSTVYVEAVLSGCISGRLPVSYVVLPILDTPVVTVTSVGSNSITYSWAAVPGAASYQYSLTGVAGSYVPVTGGLTQTISGLAPLQSQIIFVQALGIRPCQTSNSGQATGTTICGGFTVQVVSDTVRNCPTLSVTMDVLNPLPLPTTYTWYNSAGTAVGNNSSYTTNVGSTIDSFFVEANTGGCVSSRTRVIVLPLQQLAVPNIILIDSTLTTLTFTWTDVSAPGGYILSINGGPFNVTPSGPGLTHTITGLTPGQSQTIQVRALGTNPCQNNETGIVTGTTKVCQLPATPIVTVIDSTQFSVTFSWTSTAATYTVTYNTAVIYTGPLTTYTVTGLNPGQTVSITVVANGVAPCPNSNPGTGTGSTKGCVALPAPTNVRFVDSSSTFATFSWPAVSGATGYKVEVQTGNPPGAWTTIAANQQGTVITISGLITTDSVRVRVTSLGTLACENSITATIGRGRTALDQIYIPNAFTPNGSGNPENERLRVYSNIIKDGRFMIFNQWGQKIYEANTIADMKTGWDGSYGGKPQPVGVYIFVGKFTLTNGNVIEKKGSINLVR